MIKYIILLISLSLPLYAGITRAVSNTVQQQAPQASKKAYKDDGSIDLEVIVDAKLGESITFKLPDTGTTTTGTITQVEGTPNKGLRVIGVFDERAKSGFMFYFKIEESKSFLAGSLIFIDKGVAYQLKFKETDKTFYFEKQSIKPRDIEFQDSKDDK